MKKDILVLSPHTNDGEIGCGGTIAKHIRNGDNVTFVVFSICEKSVPENCKKDILLDEVQKSTKALGINKDNVFICRFEVREFLRDRQNILEKLVELKQEHFRHIDIMYSPNSTDIHQDHHVIFSEARRLFKDCTHLGYEMPWNDYGFYPQCYSSLDMGDIETKVLALNQYKSQFFRPAFSTDHVINLAKYRGMEIGKPFAEAFEVIRMVY
jgi:N-acetylglucosamine malate deacetylase 1